MGSAIGAVDHGIGLAGQLVMQASVDKPADDRRPGPATVDYIVGWTAILASLGESAVHGFDDVASHPKIAQPLLGIELDHLFAGRGRRGKPHRFQMLEPADHEATDLGIVEAGPFWPPVD